MLCPCSLKSHFCFCCHPALNHAQWTVHADNGAYMEAAVNAHFSHPMHNRSGAHPADRQTDAQRQTGAQTDRERNTGRQTDQGGKAQTGATVNARFLHSVQNTCRAHESQSLFLSWCVFRSTRRCGVSARTNIFVNQHTPDGALKIAGHQSMTDLEQTNQHHTSHTHTSHTHIIFGEGG